MVKITFESINSITAQYRFFILLEKWMLGNPN